MTRACVHGCDTDGWIDTKGGLMPCPRHNRDTHERWAQGDYRATGPTGTAPTATPDPTTTARGLAAARQALHAKPGDPPCDQRS
jgi:hypothetical protein